MRARRVPPISRKCARGLPQVEYNSFHTCLIYFFDNQSQMKKSTGLSRSTCTFSLTIQRRNSAKAQFQGAVGGRQKHAYLLSLQLFWHRFPSRNPSTVVQSLQEFRRTQDETRDCFALSVLCTTRPSTLRGLYYYCYYYYCMSLDHKIQRGWRKTVVIFKISGLELGLPKIT